LTGYIIIFSDITVNAVTWLYGCSAVCR